MVAKKNAVATVSPLNSLGALMTEHGAALSQLGITANSFNTMAVVKKSNHLKGEKELLESERAGLVASKKKLGVDIETFMKRLEQAAVAKAASAFKVFAKIAKIKKPDVTASAKMPDDGKYNITINMSYSSNAHHGGGCMRTDLKSKAPKSLITLYKKRTSTCTEIVTKDNELMKIRVQLQNIGELEREANAGTTHAMLSRTPDGKKLLAAMDLEDLG